MDERTELLRKIAMLCIDINGIGDGNRLENGKPTVFMDLSGHTGTAQVRIFESGWFSDSYPDFKFDLDDIQRNTFEFIECIDHLEMIKERL